MNSITYEPWHLTVDRAATERAYAAIPQGGPEECGCAYCRNFAAVRDQVYPPEALALFTRLGIDPCREAEVVDYHGKDESGHRLVGGWFHFVGRIEDGPDTAFAWLSERFTSGFMLGFTRTAVVVEDAFHGLAIAQLEFFATIPWVLDEPNPD